MEKNSKLIKTALILLAALMIITLLVVAIILSAGRSEGGNENAGGGGNVGEQNPEPELPKTVSYYLYQQRVPLFISDYLDIVEQTYQEVYYKPEDIPESEQLAEQIAELYLEYFDGKIDSSDYMTVTYALVDCLIEVIGDKYSFFRTKEETLLYDTNMSGSFAGIGVEILRNNIDNTVLVEVVYIGSPAESAGMLPGDYIVGVDGASIEQIGAMELVNRIRGEVGDPVVISVMRNGVEIELEMVRATLTEQSVELSYLEDGKIANIRITGFKGNTYEQFVEAVNEVEASGAKAIIFDLRGNGGGYLKAVSNMLSYLVPDGTPIASFSSNRAPLIASSGESMEHEPEDHVLTLPCTVVVNGNSASASELFTAAIRDYNDMELIDGTVIGSLTYKKGVLQSSCEYTDGSTLTLTTSFYNPPSGINFDGVGVEPDIPVNEGDDPIKTAVSFLMEKLNQE